MDKAVDFYVLYVYISTVVVKKEAHYVINLLSKFQQTSFM